MNFIRYIFITLSCAFFIPGLLYSNFNLALIGILLIWSSNVLFCLVKFHERILFLLFHFTLALFLLGRPVVSMLRGTVWWKTVSPSALQFSLIALELSLFCLALGAAFFERVHINHAFNKQFQLDFPQVSTNRFVETLRLVSLSLFFICLFAHMVLEVDKLLFMRARTYIEYYSSYPGFRGPLSIAFRGFAGMMVSALCIYLSTLPTKRQALIPLACLVLSAVPILIIGVRGPIMLNCVFVFFYYVFRDVSHSEHKQTGAPILRTTSRYQWIGLFEKMIIIISIPLSILFLNLWTSVRGGWTNKASLWDSFVNFFYSQGISFDVLGYGYQAIPNLPSGEFRNYTFGSIIDYWSHGQLAQLLFGAKSLGTTGNNMLRATQGNSFAHHMSYLARGHDSYLAGNGYGSSYLLEVYVDFGYLGIALFSIALGFILLYLVKHGYRHWFLLTMVLMISTKILYIPRAEATGWLLFLFTAQFWVAICFCTLLAGLLVKPYNVLSHQTERLGMPCLKNLV